VQLPDGWVAVVKRDCPTCELVAPVLAELAAAGSLTAFSQDDPAFPPGVPVVDDRELEVSWRLQVQTVPTLLRVRDGGEVERTEGWLRERWEALTGVRGLGAGLPDHRPGCGSRSVEWGVEEALERRFGGRRLASRRVELADLEDEVEALHDRGWTDGLPVVPPTEERVLRMLTGTSRDPDEVVAVVPPDLVACTVEKVAGQRGHGRLPARAPAGRAGALEAACTEEFALHGLLATTVLLRPLVVVERPGRAAVGMNSGTERPRPGQPRQRHHRPGACSWSSATSAAGRPGEVDQATLGNPGKLTSASPSASTTRRSPRSRRTGGCRPAAAP
jgi:hypothetical protein